MSGSTDFLNDVVVDSTPGSTDYLRIPFISVGVPLVPMRIMFMCLMKSIDVLKDSIIVLTILIDADAGGCS